MTDTKISIPAVVTMHFSISLFFVQFFINPSCLAFPGELNFGQGGGHQKNDSHHIQDDFERLPLISLPALTTDFKHFNITNNNNISIIVNETHRRFPEIWVANLFYETLFNFTVMNSVGNVACQKQTEMYIRHLANDSLWAVQSE